MGRTAIETPDSFCRVCKSSFSTQVGNFKKLVQASSQNVFKVSQRKESLGIVIAELCEQAGLHLVKSTNLSTKLCNGCSRKVLKASQLFVDLKSKINDPHEHFKKSSPLRNSNGKRKLQTPDRGVSPGERKSSRVNSEPTAHAVKSRKSLFAKEDYPVNSDEFLSNLNIDGLKTCEGRSSLKLKVVIVYPNGDVHVRNPTNNKTVQIIRNLALSNWTAVANGVFDHQDEDFKCEIELALKRRVNREFVTCSKSDSVLKATKPDEIVAFRNKLVAVEAKTQCPLFSACIQGAAGSKATVNELSLMTAIAARTRNTTMSAVAFRISNLLIHSGAKFEDIRRLNNLGVCMSPKSAVRMQKSMGETFDSKVLKWKSKIEENQSCLKLLGEVLERQTPSLEEDSMDLEVMFDIREEVLKSYNFYAPSTYDKVVQVFGSGSGLIAEECLKSTIHQLKYQKLPYYK